MNTLLDKVKLSLQLTDNTFDNEVSGYIDSAKTDLGFGNVETIDETDGLTQTAIILFCGMRFNEMHGDIQRAEAIRKSYDSFKMQMGLSSKYNGRSVTNE